LGCATFLADLEAQHGDPDAAWELFAGAIGGYRDAGDFESAKPPLASLAVFLSRIGRFESAAVIGGYSTNAMTENAIPELAATADHLRSVVGDERFDMLAAQARAMAPAEAVRFALDEIERARQRS
jgi:phosphoglycolate phosphatase-like HAD superfamily hydrolase